MQKNSFKWKLIVPVITVSILGILFSGFFAHHIARREILRGVNREINLTAQEIAAQLASFFSQRNADLESFSEVPLIQDYFNNRDFGLNEEAESYLAGLRNFFSVFIDRTGVHSGAGLLDRRGKELCRAQKGGAGSPPEARFFTQAKAAGPAGRYISEVVTADGEAPFMIYAKPVYNSSGEFKGVVYLKTDLTAIAEKLNRLKVGASGFSFVTDRENRVILGVRSRADDYKLKTERKIPGTSFSVTVVADSSDFLAPLAQIRLATWMLVIFSGLCVSLFIYAKIRFSLSPIETLVKAAGRFSKGDLDHTVEGMDCAEFSVLAKAFNEMASSIKQRSEDLKDRIRQLYSLQKMSSSIVKKLNIEEICRICLEASTTGLGFERGLLYWINPAAGTITGKYSCGVSNPGFTEENFRKRSVPIDSDDILAHAARTGKPVNVVNTDKEPRCNPNFLKETSSKAFCLVPIGGSSKIFGILAVDNWYSNKPITDENMKNLSTFCNATGLALQNAELFENLLESQSRHITTINGVTDAIAGLDDNFLVRIWNRSAERMFNLKPDEMKGRSIFSLLVPEQAQLLRQELDRAGFAKDLALKGRDARTGAETNLSLTLTPIERETHGREWSAAIRDITEQTKLQTQILKTEKLSVIGQLISGIAHELNNPLAAVVGYAELLNNAENPPPTLKEDLTYILKNAARCHAIVKTLLNFVRQRQAARAPCQINDVIDSTLDLMRYKLEKSSNIKIERLLDNNLPLLSLDAQQIGQVFVNLIWVFRVCCA